MLVFPNVLGTIQKVRTLKFTSFLYPLPLVHSHNMKNVQFYGGRVLFA